MNIPKTLIVIGRSGSGKGTQIEILKEYLVENAQSVYHFESGNLFRNMVKGEGYTNEKLREILQRGDLVPDFFTDWLLVNGFVENLKNKDQILILDGYPRTLPQVDTLEKALAYYGRNDAVTVLHINVSEQEVRNRMMARGRNDDVDTIAIENRINWYNNNVLPVIEQLNSKENYNVIDINGEGDINTIQQDIKKALNLA